MRRPRRWHLALAVGVALAGCAPSPPDSAVALESAELWLGAERPDASRPGERVTLPDRWFLNRRRQATQGWYRMQVDLEGRGVPMALLVRQARLNAEFFVNGTSLGRIGRFEPPIARSQAVPLYFRIPEALVRPGTNTVEVRLATTPGFPGRLDPIWIGPVADLRPAYERLSLLLMHAPRLAHFAAILLGLALLAQAATRRPDRAANAFLGTAAIFMAIAGVGYWAAEIPIPGRLREWASGCLTHWASLLLLLSVHRFLGISRPVLERRLLAVFAAASVLLGVVPHLYALAVWTLWLCLAIGLYAYLFYLLVRGARSGRVHPSVPIVAFITIAPWLGPSGVGILGGVLTLVWFVVSRAFQRLRETEAANRQLESLVAEREAEVRRGYERLNELERARAVAHERERLMRDMHDGTGGQLISALALARAEDLDRDSLIGILQETLDDLRLTIESLDPGARDLPSVLGMMRATLERRLTPSGLRLVWQVGESGSGLSLTPENALHVIRIVQEAITNTIKHADGAETVTIRTSENAGELVVEVIDDGCGASDLDGGRGVGNMRGRAAAMGARAEVVPAATAGTVVRLAIPDAGAAPQSSERTIPS